MYTQFIKMVLLYQFARRAISKNMPSQCLTTNYKQLSMTWKKSDQTYVRKQESPPSWMQESYHPLCSKYTLCCSSWGVTPPSWPGWGGTPWGNPPSWTGMNGYPTPSWPGIGVPLWPDLEWGSPCPDLGWGYPLSRPRMGLPHPHHPDLGWVYPPSRPGMGVLPLFRCGLTNWKQYLPPLFVCGR